jgi:seryl-tRNA synthetase
MPPKVGPGRPRKTDQEGTPEQIAKRNYQRKYQSEVRQGIVELEIAEKNCLKELERIRNDRNKLINMLSSANEQSLSILKEIKTSKKM